MDGKTRAVVIGSGPGGLTAALALARAGLEVQVFERHRLPGGSTRSISLEGHRFSPGVHYIGELGEGGATRRIYEGLGVSEWLSFIQLNPEGYSRVRIGDEGFDIPAGRAALRERLSEYFPREAKGIRRYLDAVDTVAGLIRGRRRGLGDVAAAAIAACGDTAAGFVCRYVDDPLLRAVLTLQAGDHGLGPARVPAALHAALVDHYLDGGGYPAGGGGSIAGAYLRALRRAGAEVHLGTPVRRVLVRGGRAVGVALDGGIEVPAELVISNADPAITWGQLVPGEHIDSATRRRLSRTRSSASVLSLLFAIDADPRELGMDSGNTWYSASADIDAIYRFAEGERLGDGPLPGLFLTATSLKDPSCPRPAGTHSLEAFCFVPRAPWRDRPQGDRPRDYTALKDRLSERMFSVIERLYPGLSRSVIFRDLGTPLADEHSVSAPHSAICDAEEAPRSLGPFGHPVRTHLPGLYLCGASTLAPGVLGATLSGLEAAGQALGCPREALLTAGGPPLRLAPSSEHRPTLEAVS